VLFRSEKRAERWTQLVDEWMNDPVKLELHVRRFMPSGTLVNIFLMMNVVYVTAGPPSSYKTMFGPAQVNLDVAELQQIHVFAMYPSKIRTREGMVKMDENIRKLGSMMQSKT
jgi:hypothetical protein